MSLCTKVLIAFFLRLILQFSVQNRIICVGQWSFCAAPRITATQHSDTRHLGWQRPVSRGTHVHEAHTFGRFPVWLRSNEQLSMTLYANDRLSVPVFLCVDRFLPQSPRKADKVVLCISPARELNLSLFYVASFPLPFLLHSPCLTRNYMSDAHVHILIHRLRPTLVLTTKLQRR